MFINRIEERAQNRVEDAKETYLSFYEILENITNEIISDNKNLVSDITLGNIPESALEMRIIRIINKFNYKVETKSRTELVKDVLDNIFGYSVLQKYLDLKDCNGIFVNGPDNIWVQIKNKRERINENFGSNKNVLAYIRSIAAKTGGEINENKPLAKFQDAKNKLRIVACINPVAQFSPTLVFRKHREENFTIKDLIELGMLTQEMGEELIRYNNAGANIVFCGKGGAGKTTLARASTEELPEEERILLIEEHPEWFLKHPNAISRLVKRNEKGNVTGLAELTDMGLLESIDRYIFGEIRGSEAMYFFKGGLSGNITMSTTHSSSSRDVIDMLAINMKMSGTDISIEVLKEILYKSINIIVYLDRFTVTDITEVVYENEADRLNKLWDFKYTRKESTFVEGQHVKKGNIKSVDMNEKIQMNQNCMLGKEKIEWVGCGS